MPQLRSHRPWLLREPGDDAQLLLFCLPYSGCGASIFRRWPHRIGPVEVCPVQLPARENRIAEPHFGTLEALADAVCDGLSSFLDRPYALFGHCAGALQAYEVALRVTERSFPMPRRIFLSSQPPPDGAAEPSGFTAMSESELRAELCRLLAGIGSTPTEETLDLYLSVYRPDLAAVRRYRQARPTGAPLTVIGWTESGVPAERLAGWAAYGDVTFESLPGGHYDFLAAPPGLQDLFLSTTSTLTNATAEGRTTS